MYQCFYREPRIYIGRIPRGYAGTRKTVGYIVHLVKEGAKDFCVRQKAINILIENAVRPKDYMGEIEALFEWVKNNVRYTRDIYRVELLHTARRMLELRAGDCDDMTILLGAMLVSIGHPVRLALAGFRPKKPYSYSHIYPEVNVKGKWIALDPTMDCPIGWAPPALWKRICEI